MRYISSDCAPMSMRRALLIGASEYGEGFFPLPAVRTDVAAVSKALLRCGYEIETASPEIVSSPNRLGDAIQHFCDRCGPDDIHVLYFSGHGMILDSEDCIIPAKVSYDDALRRRDKRINTDLTGLLKQSHGLIAFIIDACRSEGHAPVTKSGAGWGDHRVSERAESFVRFFGCRAGEVCRVIEAPSEPTSVFSKCLSDALIDGSASTLKELLLSIHDRCKELADRLKLQVQTPRLSYGEDSVEMDVTLNRRIFDILPQHFIPGLWDTFDPNKLHCIVISSERETETPPASTLEELVRSVTLGKSAPDVWCAFRTCCDGTRLVSGARRSTPPKFDVGCIRNAAVSINAALQSPETLKAVIRALIEADLAVVDVTGFEPGVMMLLGVRAACRRGVTICSHGNTWREGQPLELPFNLQDLSIASHTPRDQGIGPDPVVNRFLERVLNGFKQLARQSRYLDLPPYDALRQLGPGADASATIEIASNVLVLCPYEKAFFGRWDFLSKSLETELAQSHDLRPEIRRIIDFGNPQLVSQSIYEQCRRTSGCVTDWSSFSPSVFLEFGVRAAVSEWGAVSMIDDTFAAESRDSSNAARSSLRQVAQLRALFEPHSYNFKERRGDFDKAVAALVDRHPHLRTEEGLSLVHEVAWRAVGVVQPAWPEVFQELSNNADALSKPRHIQTERPQVLFYEADPVKTNSESAALERRIAAWLYMDRRLGPERLAEDEEIKRTFRKLARTLRTALQGRGEPQDLMLVEYIDSRVKDIK
jgi:hypothetical protein